MKVDKESEDASKRGSEDDPEVRVERSESYAAKEERKTYVPLGTLTNIVLTLA